MKYIDADKLIAKIQPLYEEAKDKSSFASQTDTSSDCAEWIYKHILHLITSLQHEQVDVDLEKEIENVKKIQMNYDFTNDAIKKFFIEFFAKHFFELGLKVSQKGE